VTEQEWFENLMAVTSNNGYLDDRAIEDLRNTARFLAEQEQARRRRSQSGQPSGNVGGWGDVYEGYRDDD
jgi:hypothetical protein